MSEIKKLVNKIIETEEEEQLEYMISLENKIKTKLTNNTFNDIEDTLDFYLNENLTINFDTLMSGVMQVVENDEIEVDGKVYSSTMLVLPCTFVSSKNGGKIPSLTTIETKLRDLLIEEKAIKTKDQFHLASVRLNKEATEEMTLPDWWNLHNEALKEIMSNGKVRNKELRQNETNYDVAGLSSFYLVPIVIDREDNYTLLENIDQIINHTEIWTKLGETLSNENITITVLPPTGILEGLENAEYVMQGVEFDIFFSEYAMESSVDIAYTVNKSNKEEVVILLIDSENKQLLQYFKYDTEGDMESFIHLIVEKCMEKKSPILYNLEKEIGDEELKKWASGEVEADMNKYCDSLVEIDLIETKKHCDLICPTLDSLTPQSIKH